MTMTTFVVTLPSLEETIGSIKCFKYNGGWLFTIWKVMSILTISTFVVTLPSSETIGSIRAIFSRITSRNPCMYDVNLHHDKILKIWMLSMFECLLPIWYIWYDMKITLLFEYNMLEDNTFVSIIVGKSDFDHGILILESIFPNFSEYFS